MNNGVSYNSSRTLNGIRLGGSRGGGELEGSFGTVVRARFLKPTPIIYLIFEKNERLIYLIEQFFTYSNTVL